MFRIITRINITQQPTKDFPNRKKIFNIDFCVGFEIESTWENMTQTLKLTLPKAIKFKDVSGSDVNIQNRDSVDSTIGGFDKDPLFLRGDKITLTSGYFYFDANGVEQFNLTELFAGYVTKISSKKPFALECEDSMYLLKLIPTPVKQWAKTDTLNAIVNEMIKGSGLTVSTKSEINIKYNIGALTTNGESVAEFLKTTKEKTFRLDSRFRGTELRIGFPIYFEDEASNLNFEFQKNITSDDLEYSRKDDLILSAVVQNYIIEATGKLTKDGQAKTRKKRLEVLVTIENGKEKSYIAEKNKPLPPNVGGERRKFFNEGITTTQGLIDFGFKELRKYYYDGFRGSFTTFGIPYVKYGDNVTIKDNVLPERNGTYKVKKVVYSLGDGGGLRQKITLHYRINI